MKITTLLTGSNFNSLIACASVAENYFKENIVGKCINRNDYLNKLKCDLMHLSLLTIAVYISINMMLILLFIFPYAIISFSFNIPTPIMVAQIYIPSLFFFTSISLCF